MQRLIERIEAAGFQCAAGPLTLNQDWLLLKAELGIEGLLPVHTVGEGAATVTIMVHEIGQPARCVDHRICERDDCGRGPNPKCDQYRPETEPVDEMYEQAVATVKEAGSASISMIQRRLRIGYNRAARILEAMEEAGIVTVPGEFGKRDVIGAQKKTCTCPSC